MTRFFVFAATLAMLFVPQTWADETVSEINMDDYEQYRDSIRRRSSDNPDVHDPVMAYENGRYYIFSTGMGISVMSSVDMKTWKRERPVFSAPPRWAEEMINGYRGHTWAPDISYVNGMWYLYYSCSAFGKNTSAIGLAVNKTLDPESPDYKWEDRGLVVRSVPGENNWNAIDPNLILDKKDKPWLFFGSFWDGIQLVKLDDEMTGIIKGAKFRTVSRRVHLPNAKPGESAGVNAVEAPFVFRNGDYYYLLVSFDYCCKGLNSTYKTVVGRSKKIEGPYYDKSGKKMEEGGGTLLVGPNEKYAGIGHCAAYKIEDKWYFVAHAYSKADNGASKLYIRTMFFDDEGWPKLEE